MISASEFIGVAGGAFRNLTGHWKVGCYQTDIRNYFLRIVEGYKYSAYGCMFCDYLEGPFVARASIMKKIQFNQELSGDVVFNDWFLRIKQANVLVMNCPDAMYFTQGRSSFHEQKQNSWLMLAKEWEIHRIFVPPNIIYLFSCKEVGLSCRTAKRPKEHLMPSCCLVQMARAGKTLDEFASRYGISYELDSGTLLGAVKLRTHLPWDVDADVRFDKREYQTFFKKQNVFNTKGLKLKAFNPEQKGYFQIWTLPIWGLPAGGCQGSAHKSVYARCLGQRGCEPRSIRLEQVRAQLLETFACFQMDQSQRQHARVPHFLAAMSKPTASRLPQSLSY
jgi:hypothetical protein